MVLFLTIAIGYLLGELSIGGLSLGVGHGPFCRAGHGLVGAEGSATGDAGELRARAFSLCGWHSVREAVLHRSTSASGLKDNLVALSGVLISGAVALLFVRLLNLKTAYALGLFAGSGTSTLRCRPPLRPLGNDDPAGDIRSPMRSVWPAPSCFSFWLSRS
jgi:putative transport protein